MARNPNRTVAPAPVQPELPATAPKAKRGRKPKTSEEVSPSVEAPKACPAPSDLMPPYANPSMLTGTHCSLCGGKQYIVKEGGDPICGGGHVAPPLEETRAPLPGTEAPKVVPAKKAALPVYVPKKKARHSFKFIAFGDLHVSSKTLDRALDVLDRVGQLAAEHEAYIVCLGDFWHQRASLSVRQLDAVLAKLREWGERGLHAIFVPGNHDQVSMDGTVHAVKVFEAFAHVTMATEVITWDEQRIAFIPWRESDHEQEKLLESLDGDDWTIFTHAEIQGAKTNHGHEAQGRMSLSLIGEKARCLYAAHYHKRQRLGDRSWYIGSPFEMDKGERHDPHGVALIDYRDISPAFIDFDDLPKHIVGTWPEDRSEVEKAREQDVVELHMTRGAIASPELGVAMASIKAKDIRPLPIKEDVGEDGAPKAPTIALTLDAGIDVWLVETKLPEDQRTAAALMAKGILAEVADAKTIVPLAPSVRVLSLATQDFCRLQGSMSFDLASLGPVLIQGPMGSGKTAIPDAITWCLYGVTSPRNAKGQMLRTDDVIHDAASFTSVRVSLQVGDRVVHVTRTKNRGTGAKISIDGMAEAEGISDQQAMIHRLIGLDESLWRAAVYLGQGTVESFVSSADKKRKEPLIKAFHIAACEPALKLVRERAKTAVAARQQSEVHVATNQMAIDTIASSSYIAQAETWEVNRRARYDGLVQAVNNEIATVTQIDQHLASEAQWQATRAQYQQHLESLHVAAGASTGDGRTMKITADLGGYQNERAFLAVQLSKAQQRHQHVASSDAPICEKCQQPIDVERHAIQITEIESEVRTLTAQINTLDHRIAQANHDLREMQNNAAPALSGMQQQIEETKSAIAKCEVAFQQFAALKENRAAAMSKHAIAMKDAESLTLEVNPFTALAAEANDKMARHTSALNEAKASVAAQVKIIEVIEACETMFSSKGLPALILRTVLHELEMWANHFLAILLQGKLYCRLSMKDDDLDVEWFELTDGKHVERTFLQLSGGQRRCAELAFSPFALAEMIFARCGVRIPFLVVDELTTHLDMETKPLLCELLRKLDRETVLVIDHDAGVRGEFDVSYQVIHENGGSAIVPVSVTE